MKQKEYVLKSISWKKISLANKGNCMLYLKGPWRQFSPDELDILLYYVTSKCHSFSTLMNEPWTRSSPRALQDLNSV